MTRKINEYLQSSQKYVAVKILSAGSYELLAMSVNSNGGSLIALSPGEYHSVSIDSIDAENLFSEMTGNGRIEMRNSVESKSMHPECAFVRVSISSQQDVVLVDASRFQYEENLAEQSFDQLNIYFGLQDLVRTHIRDFRQVADLPSGGEFSSVDPVSGIEAIEVDITASSHRSDSRAEIS